MIKFDNEINCGSCKYGYLERFSNDGYHKLCGAEKCSLCATMRKECDSYEKGEIPEGKEREFF